MDIRARVSGDVEKLFLDEIDAIKQRVTRITAESAFDLREDMREAIRAAGLGDLGQALGYDYQPRRAITLHPAAEVFVRGKAASTNRWKGVLEAYLTGTTIRGRNGWLAIPTKAVPRRGRRTMTPDEAAEEFGPLTSVAKGQVVLLFADLVAGRSGGVRRATAGRMAQGREANRTLLYVLVRQVRISKRLDFDGIVQRWQRRFPRLIEAAVRG